MKLTLTTSAALLVLSGASVFAEPTASSNLQLQMMLKRAERAQTPAATVSRSAKVVADITVNIKSKVTEPAMCSLMLQHMNPMTQSMYMETGTAPLKISGKKGTCAPTVPFSWSSADSNFPVDVMVQIVDVDGTTEGRLANHSLPAIQLPGQNKTQTIEYALDF